MRSPNAAAASTPHMLPEDSLLAQRTTSRRRQRPEDTRPAQTLKVRRNRRSRRPYDRVDESGVLVMERLLLRRVDIGGRSGASFLTVGPSARPPDAPSAATQAHCRGRPSRRPASNDHHNAVRSVAPPHRASGTRWVVAGAPGDTPRARTITAEARRQPLRRRIHRTAFGPARRVLRPSRFAPVGPG
jgi:hypothetical protein